MNCNLLLSIIIIRDPQNNPSKSSVLNTHPRPASHFLSLFYYNSPPTRYSSPFKGTSYFIYLLFALKYKPFNISLFSFINLHTSFFCNFIAPNDSFQPLFFQLHSLPHYSTIHSLGSFPPLSVSHKPLLHCQPLVTSPAPTFAQHFYLHSILLSFSQNT